MKISIPILFVAIHLASAEHVSKMLRSQCIVHNPEGIQNVSCWARPKSRTVSIVNMRANLTRLVQKAFLNVQLYKRSELKFRPFLLNVTEDYCKFFAKTKSAKYLQLLTSIYLPYTNMNHTCPYFGHVYIKDLPLDANNIPAIWPVGEYHLDVIVISGEGRLITMQFFIEIKDKPNG